MASPTSWLTRVRMVLARWVEPKPDPGEAWCIGCSLNSGRTAVVSAAGHQEHAQVHAAGDGEEMLRIWVTWPDP